jgi:hypothetical protein
MPYKDKQKQNAYQVARMKRLREEWLAANGPCKCGSCDQLEVDHIDPTTKVSHRIWSWSEKRRCEELKKCQVLWKCHIEKSADEARQPLIHGTYSAYSWKLCRCDECREAARRQSRKWVSKKAA